MELPIALSIQNGSIPNPIIRNEIAFQKILCLIGTITAPINAAFPSACSFVEDSGRDINGFAAMLTIGLMLGRSYRFLGDALYFWRTINPTSNSFSIFTMSRSRKLEIFVWSVIAGLAPKNSQRQTI